MDNYLKGKELSLNDIATYTEGIGEERVILSFYVHNILVIVQNLKIAEEVKENSSKEFEMEEFEDVDFNDD